MNANYAFTLTGNMQPPTAFLTGPTPTYVLVPQGQPPTFPRPSGPYFSTVPRVDIIFSNVLQPAQFPAGAYQYQSMVAQPQMFAGTMQAPYWAPPLMRIRSPTPASRAQEAAPGLEEGKAPPPVVQRQKPRVALFEIKRTSRERQQKIQRYKEKLRRWREKHPISRKFSGRRLTALRRARDNGRFAGDKES